MIDAARPVRGMWLSTCGGGAALILLAAIFSWDIWHAGANRIVLRVAWGEDGLGRVGAPEWVWPLFAWMGLALAVYLFLLRSDVSSPNALMGAAVVQYHPLTLLALSTNGHLLLLTLFVSIALVALSIREMVGLRAAALALLVIGSVWISWRVALVDLVLVGAWKFGGLRKLCDGEAIALPRLVAALAVVGAVEFFVLPPVVDPASAWASATYFYPGGVALVLVAAASFRRPAGMLALLVPCLIGYAFGRFASAGVLAVLFAGVFTGRSLQRWTAGSAPVCQILWILKGCTAILAVWLLVYPSVRIGRISGGRDMFDVQPYTLTSLEYLFYLLFVVTVSGLVLRWWTADRTNAMARFTLAALLLLDLWSLSHTYYRPFLPVSDASLAKEAVLRQEPLTAPVAPRGLSADDPR